MLLTSWIRALRQSFSRRRALSRVRRQVGSTSPVSLRKHSVAEVLEERSLLAAFVLDSATFTSTATSPGINITNSTLDANNDGISDFDNLVIASSDVPINVSGTGVGIRINLTNLTGLNHITIENVTVTGGPVAGASTFQGISVTLNNVAIQSLTVDQATVTSTNANGIDLNLQNIGTVGGADVTIKDSTVRSTNATGVQVTLGSTTQNARLAALNFADSTLEGIGVTSTAGATFQSTIDQTSVKNTRVQDGSANPVARSITYNLTRTTVGDLRVEDNPLFRGVSITTTDSPLNAVTIADNANINLSAITAATNGINITATTTNAAAGTALQADVENLLIRNNTIAGNIANANTAKGIVLTLTDSNLGSYTDVQAGATIRDNTIRNLSGNLLNPLALAAGVQITAGVQVLANGTSPFVTANGGLPLLVDFDGDAANDDGNGILNNLLTPAGAGGRHINGQGLVISTTANTTFRGDITGNTIQNIFREGMLLSFRDRPTDATFDSLALNIDGNTVDQVRQAGIDLSLVNSAVGAFTLTDNTVTSVEDPVALTPDAISVSLIGTNVAQVAANILRKSFIEGNFLGVTAAGVAGQIGRHGIFFTAQEASEVQDLQIRNNTIRTVQGDGIAFDRQDRATLLTVNPESDQVRAVTIADNSVTNSAQNGISLDVQNGSLDLLDFEVRDNFIGTDAAGNDLGNGGDGINLVARADARMLVDITNNRIQFNNGDGIDLLDDSDAVTDKRQIGGTWNGNTISNNSANGINIRGRHGLYDEATGIITAVIIGQETNDASNSNIIQSNGGNGLRITSTGEVGFTDNLVASNGSSGIFVQSGSERIAIRNNQIEANVGKGIDLEGGGRLDASIRNNVVTRQVSGALVGDGIELTNRGANMNVLATGNFVSENAGKGVEVLNLGSGAMQFRFGDGTAEGLNTVQRNQQVGFYVVNSTDFGQQEDVLTVSAGGAATSSPDMMLDVDTNIIENNGQGTVIAGGSGLVLRAGSAGAPGTGGGGSDLSFAATYAGEVGATSGAPGAGNGRINARITNNRFEGNFGNDFVVDPFISNNQNDPNFQTTGTWNSGSAPPVFNIASIQHDPLARVNLVFNGNTGNGIDVQRGEPGFTNNEADFKSRTANHNPGPGGPFGSGTRSRSIIRLGGDGAPNFPTVGYSMVYPALDPTGASTLRVEAGFDRSGIVAGFPFFSTSAPGPGSDDNFDDPGSWTVVPVGTFSYPDVDAPTLLMADVVDFATPLNTSPGVVQIDFTEFVVNVDITDFRLLRDGVLVPLESAPGVPLAVTPVLASEDPNNPGAFSSFTIDLSIPSAIQGDYELQVLSVDSTNPTFTSIRDVILQLNGVGNSLTRVIDGDGVLQEYTTRHLFTVDTSNPVATISSITPLRNSAAGIVTVTFDESVSGVDIADFTLTRDDDGLGPNVPVAVNLGSVTVVQVSNSVYTLNLNQLTGAPGDYRLQLVSTDPNPSSQILDAANNLVANVGGIAAFETWTVDTTLPVVISIDTAPSTSPNNIINSPVTSAQINFQESVTGVDLSDFKLTLTNASGTVSDVPLTALTTPFFQNSALQYEINLSAVTTTAGTYTLTLNAVNSGIFDLAQNALETSFPKTWVLDTSAPGLDIVDVAPDPRQAPVDALNTIFTEAVSGLTIDQYVLAFDDGTNATSGTIGNATNAPTIVVTSNGHGLTNGTRITVYGVQGNTNANGVFTVMNVTANTFELFDLAMVPNAVPGNGIYTSGGRWARNISLGASSIEMQTPTRFVANLAAVTNNPGTYLVSLLANGAARDTANNPLTPATSPLADIPMHLRDSLGFVMTAAPAQFNVAGQDIWTYGPDVAPTGVISPLPASIATNAGTLTITFSEPLQPINGATPVDVADFQLRLNGVNVPLAGKAIITQTSATTFQLDLTATGLTDGNGNYELSLLSSSTTPTPIRDTTGNLLSPTFATGIASQITWTKIAADPSVTTITGVFNDGTDPATASKLRAVQNLTINFSTDVNFVNGLSDASQYFRLTRQANNGTGPVLPVSLDGVPITRVTARQYRINLSALTGADGRYTFTVLASDLITSAVAPLGLTLLNSKSINWTKDGTIHIVPDDANNSTNPNKNANSVLTDGTDATALNNEVVRTSAGRVTLRAAIQEANSLAGDDSIELGVGTYVLTAGGAQEDSAVSGDLDILQNLTIRGKGAGQTIIDASGLPAAQRDRIFQVMSGATLTLQGVTLLGGSVLGSQDGGAILNSGTLNLSDATIGTTDATLVATKGNRSQDDAGAILNAGTATITRTTIAGNTATGVGTGGAIRNTGTLMLTNSTLSGNTSASHGGGLINVLGATATLEGVTISGNTATSGAGGGIRNDGTLRLINDTIAFNRSVAAQGGAGISRNGVITIGNTIVSDNLFTNATLNDLSAGAFVSLGGNLIRTPVAGTVGFAVAELNQNPNLQPLASNGGPTQTHAILVNSIAVDRGLVANISAGVTTDQRGAPRLLDGPAVGNSVDSGAIEFGNFFVNTTTDTPDINPGDGLAQDGLTLTSLRAAIMESNALAGESAILLDGQVYRLDRAAPDTTAPVVRSITGVPTAPITVGGVGVVTITFSEDVAGFDLADLTLTRTVGAVVTNIPLTSPAFTLTQVSRSVYTINLANVTGVTNGLYTLSVNAGGSGIRDKENNALANSASVNWVRGTDTFVPTVAMTPIVNQPVINAGIATVTFSERVNGVSINNFSLTRNGVAVPLTGVNLTITQDANFGMRTVVTLDLTTVSQPVGNYVLSVNPIPTPGTTVTIRDTANNNLAVGASQAWSKVAFAQFAAITTPRSDAVTSVTLQFSEPVAGLVAEDFTLTYDDGTGLGFQPVTITSPTLATLGPVVTTPANGNAATQWTFTFTNNEAARDGLYQLSFDGLTNGNVLVTATGANFIPTTANLAFQVGENLSLFGDLDIFGGAAGSVQIIGVSKDVTANSLGVTVNPSIIDAQDSLGVSRDRLFDLQATSNVTISGVEMRNGRVVYERNGGGIRNLGALTINNSDLLSSFADGNGGGISNGDSLNVGTLILNGSALQSNSAGASSNPNASQFGKGGAIFNASGTVTITDGTFSSNAAFTDGGVIYNDSNTTATISSSTLSNNTAGGDGGALYNGDISTLTISTTTLASNVADADNNGEGEGGAIFTEGSATLSLNTSILRSNSARAGGALYNEDASLTLDSNLFELNEAKGGVSGGLGIGTGVGGAIFNSVGGILVLTNGVFTSNMASDDGGAIQNYGVLGITGTEFVNNVAGTDDRSGDIDNGRGGAIYNDDGSVILTSVEFSLNQSFGQAGALYNQDAGFVSISLSTFTGNSAAGDAGAIYNDDVGQVLIDRSTFASNVATGDGGGLYNDSELNSSPLSPASSQLVGNILAATGSLTLLDASQFPSQGGFLIVIGTETLLVTEVVGNTFSVVRGVHGTNAAAHNNNDPVLLVDRPAAAAVITSSTFQQNRASDGGAIFNRGFGPLNVQNSTLSANTATLTGGGLANFGNASLLNATLYLNNAPSGAGIASNSDGSSPLALVTLQNTIVAGGTTSADLSGSDANFSDAGHNLIEDVGTITLFGASGTNILGQDPQLDVLQDNGGPTFTHALLFGSLARDTGDNVGTTAGDQRGFTRIFDGDGNGIATVDIGAFESGFIINSFADTIDENILDGINADRFGVSTLRATIMQANARVGEDTIILSPGTYTLTLGGRDEDGAITGDLDITDTLNIIGSGTDQTFIDAAQIDRIFHVLPGVNLNLSNLTLQRGNASTTENGGAVRNEGTVALRNVRVLDSSAALGGGLFNDTTGTLTVNDSLFRGNTAFLQGGAIYNNGSLELTGSDIGVATQLAASLTNSRLTASVAATASGATSMITLDSVGQFPTTAGFVIQVDAEQMLVTAIAGTTFTVTRGVNGTAAVAHATNSNVGQTTVTVADVSSFPIAPGFVIRIDSEEMRVTAISGNQFTVVRATNGVLASHVQNALVSQGNVANAHGGGVYNLGTALITQNFFVGNISESRGGAIYNARTAAVNTVDIRQSTFADNFASSRGAAIYNEDTLLITNSTISSNESGTNAAIGNTLTGTVDINNSTVVDNVAFRGGGLANTTLGTVTVKNTILANNQSTALAGIKAPNARGTFVTSGNNFVGNNADSAGFVNNVSSDQVGSATSPFDPVIEGLSDNGGQTLTQAPRTGSPAIDAGNNTGAADKDTVDQRGAPRPTNDDSDIGSVERQDIHLVSISDVTLAEGNSGSTAFTFTLTLNQASVEAVRINYVLQGDTAFAGEDFINQSGTVVFAAGTMIQTIVVNVNGDTSIEATEQFFVNLVNPINVTLDDTRATGTITTDDTGFRINDVNQVENDNGTQTYTFSVAVIGAVLTTNASVQYIATSASGALTAAAAAGSMTLNVNNPNAFPTSGSFTVQVDAEQLLVTSVLGNVFNLAAPSTTAHTSGVAVRLIGASTASANIAEGDLMITVADASTFPSNGGFAIQVDNEFMQVTNVAPGPGVTGIFTVIRGFNGSVATTHTAGANVTLVRTNAATGGNVDFVDQATPITLNFTAGATNPAPQTFSITVNGDVNTEANENFFIHLTGNTLPFEFGKSIGVGTIFNDDLGFNISSDSELEVDPLSMPNTSTMQFNVTQRHLVYTSVAGIPTLATTTATIQTADGTAIAGATQDFLAVNQVLTFSSGTTTLPVNVTINGDLRFEVPNETFQVQATGGTINTVADGNVAAQSNSGTGTILDNDPPPDQWRVFLDSGTGEIIVNYSTNGGMTEVEVARLNYAGTPSFEIRGDRTGVFVGGMMVGLDVNGVLPPVTQDDVFIIDFTTGLNPIPVGGLTVNGLTQNGADGIEFRNGGVFNSVTYDSINSGSGSVTFDNGLGFFVANYTGLEPVLDNTLAANRVFNAPVGASNDNITVSGSLTGLGSFVSISGATFESVSARAPFTSLTVNANGGNDVILVNSSDPTFMAALTVNGDDGNDTINLTGWALLATVNGGTGMDVITGGSNNDVIDGGDDNDIVSGGIGDDVIFGGLGNDNLTGGDGNDVIDGGDGNDIIQGNDGVDVLSGGNDNDNVDGGAGSETVDGGSGDDIVSGGDGNDVVLGNDGNDQLFGGTGDDSLDGGFGDDAMSGDTGTDTVNGQDGSDFISFIDVSSANSTFTLTNTQLTVGAEFDVLVNTERAFLVAGSGNNVMDATAFSGTVTMNGGAGLDTLRGGAGGDSLIGGTGNDSLIGNDGNDTINAGDGNDCITGGLGDDSITGDVGIDTIDGGDGNDDASGGTGNDSITGGLGLDTLDGGDGQDVVFGNDDADSVLGGAGQDLLDGGTGDDIIDGGDGDDTAFGQTGNDDVRGGAGNDTLEGNDGDDSVNGMEGNDTLNGNAGRDTLFGGANDDELISTDGNDQLLGQGGSADKFTFDGDITLADIFTITAVPDPNPTTGRVGIGLARLNQGLSFTTIVLGVELFTLNLNGGNDLVTLSDLSSVNDITVLNINAGDGDDLIDGGQSLSTTVALRAFLGAGNDTLFGGAGNDVVQGEAGNDTIFGNGGTDSIVGGDGNDSLNGNSDNDTIQGGAGTDSIWGGGGADSLFGLDGNDTIWGQAGADTIDGGNNDDSLDGGYGVPETVAGASGTGDDSIRGGAGNDKIAGRDGLDKLFGDDGNDTILGGDDNDNIDAGTGDDLVSGGNGNDTINGNAGNDVLLGGTGDDSILGGAGNDRLIGEAGKDTVDGQGGTDTVLGGNGLGTNTLATGEKRVGETINELFKITSIRSTIFNELNF
ncbi:MAG: choice-of-anchor Q domain-containing protein [Planctomycetaceae bacterium]